MGHTADKVELLILGGTWSAYRLPYGSGLSSAVWTR